MMEAKTNKERCPRCGNPAPIAQFNQPYCLGCPSCLHTWETETVDDLKSRLESAEKTIRLLKAYAVYTETGTAHGEFSTADAEAIEQIVKEERGEK